MTRTGYDQELRERARTSGLVVGVIAVMVVPAWAAFDAVLEPEHAAAFALLRLLCDVPMLVALWLLRARPLGRRRPELLTFLLLAVVQCEIAWMVVRADGAREFYLLGFSLAVYASGCVLGGPPRWTAALVGVTWSAFGLALLTAPAPMPGRDLVASSFYLGTASIIGVVAHVQRWRATASELTSRERLEAEQERSRALLERLDRLSHEDALTGLANRRRWDAELEAACATARADGRPLSVVLIDVDHFKDINDRYGHEAGDQALRHVAALLARSVRSTDLVARLGGDELAVLVVGAPASRAVALAEQVRTGAAGLRPVHGGGPLTLSLGVASGSTVPRDLMRAADEQLYRAKATRNTVCAEARTVLVPDPRAVGQADTVTEASRSTTP